MKRLKVRNSNHTALFFPQKRWDGKVVSIHFFEEPSEEMKVKVLEHFQEYNEEIEKGYQEYGPEIVELQIESYDPEKKIEEK